MRHVISLCSAALTLGLSFGCSTIAPTTAPTGRTFHVSVKGADTNDGSPAKPLRTISVAAQFAQPGDTITVHAGVYRERIDPPRGGTSDAKRITYQAAPGERVEIKGSEIIKGWTKEQGDTWKGTIPNTFFGDFNPYRDVIHGDWFDGRGRTHHTGAVYLNGDWLVEAATLEDVLKPAGSSLSGQPGDFLLNVAWLQLGSGGPETARIPAVRHAAGEGVQHAPCAEGGECIGWIEAGDWVRYDGVDFSAHPASVEIRAASATAGGRIELRLDAPDGDLLGACTVPNTGGWQTWKSFPLTIKPVGGVRNLCLVFKKATAPGAVPQLWFARVDEKNTTIWAQFPGVNPNEQTVEINVRQTVFYPRRTGINYLTVRGFILRDAATPWAPPTAEQIGLIGTHWSKGWIIERNEVSHSVCSGISLGKYGDQWDNTSANSAEGYVLTIRRALTNGWDGATVGHHVVRNNRISNCEQAGVVGSLGAIFSTITDNDIWDIHVRGLFTGAEMAGIKLHAAIDVEISRNNITHTVRGLWLDWMAQGTRVTGNWFSESRAEDLFIEVDHGPFLVDNNLLLSANSLLDWSEGGAYAHNLFAGAIRCRPEGRQTPFHPAHSTALAGITNITGGDDRFFNNIFLGTGLKPYNGVKQPLLTGGNVYYGAAQPYAGETGFVARPDFDPRAARVERGYSIDLGDAVRLPNTVPVTTELLGRTLVSRQRYVYPDDTPLVIDRDFYGKKRDRKHPAAGPFEEPGAGKIKIPLR